MIRTALKGKTVLSSSAYRYCPFYVVLYGVSLTANRKRKMWCAYYEK